MRRERAGGAGGGGGARQSSSATALGGSAASASTNATVLPSSGTVSGGRGFSDSHCRPVSVRMPAITMTSTSARLPPLLASMTGGAPDSTRLAMTPAMPAAPAHSGRPRKASALRPTKS